MILFLGFVWAELVWDANGVPASLAMSILGYCVISWAGMFIWGREVWLHHGEAFSIAFRILARFAPLDAPATDPAGGRQFNLRPPGAGLAADRTVTFSILVFVMVMLSTVTFDGYLETALYSASSLALYTSPSLTGITSRILEAGIPLQQVVLTTQMLLFPLAFIAAFWATSWAMVRAAERAGGVTGSASVHQVAMAFVLGIIPRVRTH